MSSPSQLEAIPGGHRTFGPFTAIAQIGAGRRTTAYLGHAGDPRTPLTLRVPRVGLDGDAFAADVRSARDFDGHRSTIELARLPTGSLALSHAVIGESLAVVLGHILHRARPLDLALAIHLTMGVANRLARAGETKFHGDLVPHHVLIGYDGSLHLIDPAPMSLVERMRVADRAGYRSPEHILGPRVVPQSDVFVLGILLFELTTATRLFDHPEPEEQTTAITEGRLPRPRDLVGDRYPIELQLVLRKLLRATPSGRFPDGASTREALRLVAGSRAEVREADLGAWMRRTFRDRWEAWCRHLDPQVVEQIEHETNRPRATSARGPSKPREAPTAAPRARAEPTAPASRLKATVEAHFDDLFSEKEETKPEAALRGADHSATPQPAQVPADGVDHDPVAPTVEEAESWDQALEEARATAESYLPAFPGEDALNGPTQRLSEERISKPAEARALAERRAAGTTGSAVTTARSLTSPPGANSGTTSESAPPPDGGHGHDTTELFQPFEGTPTPLFEMEMFGEHPPILELPKPPGHEHLPTSVEAPARAPMPPLSLERLEMDARPIATAGPSALVALPNRLFTAPALGPDSEPSDRTPLMQLTEEDLLSTHQSEEQWVTDRHGWLTAADFEQISGFIDAALQQESTKPVTPARPGASPPDRSHQSTEPIPTLNRAEVGVRAAAVAYEPRTEPPTGRPGAPADAGRAAQVPPARDTSMGGGADSHALGLHEPLGEADVSAFRRTDDQRATEVDEPEDPTNDLPLDFRREPASLVSPVEGDARTEVDELELTADPADGFDTIDDYSAEDPLLAASLGPKREDADERPPWARAGNEPPPWEKPASEAGGRPFLPAPTEDEELPPWVRGHGDSASRARARARADLERGRPNAGGDGLEATRPTEARERLDEGVRISDGTRPRGATPMSGDGLPPGASAHRASEARVPESRGPEARAAEARTRMGGDAGPSSAPEPARARGAVSAEASPRAASATPARSRGESPALWAPPPSLSPSGPLGAAEVGLGAEDEAQGEARIPTLVVRDRIVPNVPGPSPEPELPHPLRDEPPSPSTRPSVLEEPSASLVIPVTDDELARDSHRRRRTLLFALLALVVVIGTVLNLPRILELFLPPEAPLQVSPPDPPSNPTRTERTPPAPMPAVVPPTDVAEAAEAETLVRVKVSPEHAQILADGQPVPNHGLVAIGDHEVVLVVSLPGFRERRLVLAPGSATTVEITLEEAR